MKLWADGKVNYKPPKIYMEDEYYTGLKDDYNKPIWIKKKDIAEYMNDSDFWRMFEQWQNYKMFGLKKDWFKYPKRYIDMIQTFEYMYKTLGGKSFNA